MLSSDPPPEDFSVRFVDVFWELRARNLSCWCRLVAEELLIRSYGKNRAQVTISRLEDLAAFLGISRGNLHHHLAELLRLDIVQNDARPGRNALHWWFKEVGLWTVAPRVDPASPAGARSRAADARLNDDNPSLPGQLPLAGFEERTDAEFQADAAQERAENSPPSSLSAAGSASGSPAARSRIWNGVPKTGTPVPESGTAVPESGTPVPKSGTPAPDNARVSTRARPGCQDTEARLSQAARGREGEPGAGPPSSAARVWRALIPPETALLDELEAWCVEGGDTVQETTGYRRSWEGRIRHDRGLVERVLRDVQSGVRDGREIVKKTRGGLLKVRYDDFLRRQPPKLPGKSGLARRTPPPAVPLTPPAAPLSEEEGRLLAARMREECERQFGGGRKGGEP